MNDGATRRHSWRRISRFRPTTLLSCEIITVLVTYLSEYARGVGNDSPSSAGDEGKFQARMEHDGGRRQAAAPRLRPARDTHVLQDDALSRLSRTTFRSKRTKGVCKIWYMIEREAVRTGEAGSEESMQ